MQGAWYGSTGRNVVVLVHIAEQWSGESWKCSDASIQYLVSWRMCSTGILLCDSALSY